MGRKNLSARCGSLAALTLAVGTAQADPPPGELQEITVTAQKRTEDVQKTPISVTAETGDALGAQGITDVRGLGQLVPALELGQDYIFTQIDIRGVGTNNDAPALDPAIAFTVDGIYQARDYGTYGLFYDLDHVEVLRGPQGTLYGRNATGGSINLITNQPVDETQASAEIELGNYALFRGFAMVNVPATDDLYLRAAFQSDHHDGYLTDGFNNDDSIAGRVQALYKPSGDFSLLVGGDYFHDGGVGGDTVTGLPFAHPDNPWYDPIGTGGFHNDFRTWSLHARLDWSVAGMTLTEIPAFKDVTASGLTPVIGIEANADTEDKSFSNELRLASSAAAGGPVTWVAGLYFYNETDFVYADYFIPSFASITSNPDIAETSGAAFGQATYEVLDWLRLTAGARTSIDNKHANGEDAVFSALFSPTVPLERIPDNFDHTWRHADWKLGVDADVTPTSLAYAAIATGYLEGGFNLGSAVGFLPDFRPETLTAYTIGSKNRFLDNRLQLNAEAFYYGYTNYIVSEDLTEGPAAGNAELYNAAKTRIYGGEIEAQALATAADLATVGVALLHAQYTDFTLPQPSNHTTDLAGYQPVKSPYVTLSAGYQRSWDLADAGLVQAAVRTHVETGYWTLFDHTLGSRQPACTKTNLVLTYLTDGGRWHVQLYVDNVENAAVIATAAPPNAASGGVPWVHVEPPRTFGIRIGASF